MTWRENGEAGSTILPANCAATISHRPLHPRFTPHLGVPSNNKSFHRLTCCTLAPTCTVTLPVFSSTCSTLSISARFTMPCSHSCIATTPHPGVTLTSLPFRCVISPAALSLLPAPSPSLSFHPRAALCPSAPDSPCLARTARCRLETSHCRAGECAALSHPPGGRCPPAPVVAHSG